MTDGILGWILLAPLLGGVVAVGLWLASRRGSTAPRAAFWLDAAALVSVCLGLVAGPILLLVSRAGATFSLLGLIFGMSSVARLVLPMAHAGLLTVVLFAWDDGSEGKTGTRRIRPVWVVWAAVAIAPLLAGALMVSNRTLQALFLFGVALIVSAAALARSGPDKTARRDIEARIDLGGRLAGGAKHLALAAIATVLFVVGATLIERYSLSLEKRSLLQLGVSLLSVGVLVRVGAMPFAGAASDLLRTAPGAAILMLGVAAPAILGVGLLMLSPIEGTLVSGPQTAWIAALGVLLAGIRVLGVANLGTSGKGDRRMPPQVSVPVLAAMSVAAQVGWALFGVLSGSRMGATGAVLLAANMAIAVPLLVISSRTDESSRSAHLRTADSEVGSTGQGSIIPRSETQSLPLTEAKGPRSEIGLAIAVMSLLGLPPFGGFAGTLMVAQSAANIGGVWLGMLLTGTLLLGMAWVRTRFDWGGGVWPLKYLKSLRSIESVTPLLIIALTATQLGLFVLSGRIADSVGNWAGVPWLFTP